MKEFYYYEPRTGEENSQKKITVCLLIGDEENDSFAGYPFARGIAVCSDKDNFSRKIGRAIARGRATKALFKGNCRKIRRPEVKSLLPKEFQYKATVRPDQIGVTEKEAALIGAMISKQMLSEEEVA